MPGTRTISGTRRVASSIEYFDQQPWSPKWKPWSPRNTTIVFSASPSFVQRVQDHADVVVDEAHAGVVGGDGLAGLLRRGLLLA